MFAYCENNPISGKDPTGEFVVAAMLTGALVGMGYQFMSDVITCLIVGDATFSLSSVGDYAAAAVSGALSTVPGAGFAKAAFDLVGSAILSEGVNSLISGKKLNTKQVGLRILANSAEMALGKAADHFMPKKISDIKLEAKASGVKGAKGYANYFTKKQIRVGMKINIIRGLANVTRNTIWRKIEK